MFQQWHYVPVLRWKLGERTALKHLTEDVRRLVTPLVELPFSQFVGKGRKRPLSPEDFLKRMAADLVSGWGQAPVFVDFDLLRGQRLSDGRQPLTVFGAASSSSGARVIPVIGLQRSSAYRDAVCEVIEQHASGLGLRLVLSDFDGALAGRLERLVRHLGVPLQVIDLLIDCQFLDGVAPDYCQILRRVPHPGRWRTLTLLSGAFAKDLTEYRPGIYQRDRTDWLAWRNQVGRGVNRLARAPAFGDYTTLHPIFEEPPRGANPSASIRYTGEDHWLIMRGESLRKKGWPRFSSVDR